MVSYSEVHGGCTIDCISAGLDRIFLDLTEVVCAEHLVVIIETKCFCYQSAKSKVTNMLEGYLCLLFP